MTAQDLSLLQAVAAGDEGAFRLLHDRHVSACRHRARLVLRCEELVDDVVQTAFLDVWTHAARFDDARGSVRGWLLRLTHHKAVDAVRVQERHVARHAREELLGCDAEQAQPHDLVAAADDRARLRDALGRLPRQQREVLVLCFLAQLSQREAADVLGVPVGTVKSRTHTGVLRLRLLLGDQVPARPAAPAVLPAAASALG